MNISAAILAGGLSRRMGSDKALLPFRANPMARVIAKILRRVTGSEPFLVAKSPDKYATLGLPLVKDRMSRRCALAGVHAAINHVSSGRVLIVTCDQPFLSEPLLREMIRLSGDVVACEVDRKLQPFPVIFSADLADAVAGSFEYGILSVQENLFVGGFPTILDERRVREIDPGLRTFRNVNDRAAYRQTGVSCRAVGLK